MRHAPSAYFLTSICCSPVNIAGILLSLQKSCHKGIYLETSVTSHSRPCCPCPAAEALCSLLHHYPTRLSSHFFSNDLDCLWPRAPEGLNWTQADTWGKEAEVICQCFSNWVQRKQCQEGHHIRAAPGPRASLLL